MRIAPESRPKAAIPDEASISGPGSVVAEATPATDANIKVNPRNFVTSPP
jgi:hypothetical protein